MRRALQIAGVVLVVVLCRHIVAATDGLRLPAQDGTVVSLELQVKAEKPISLPDAALVLPQRVGHSIRIPVTLHEVTVGYRAQVSRAERTHEVRNHGLRILEVRSSDPNTPFTWSETLGRHGVVGCQIFNPNGRNYLAWLQGYTVCIAEISLSRSRAAAVSHFVSGSVSHSDSVQHIPLMELLLPDFFGPGDDWTQASIVSVARTETGLLAVQLRGASPDMICTIVGDGKAWHVQDKTPVTPIK